MRLDSPEPKSPREGALLSVVVPCFNEQEVIRNTNKELVALLASLPLRFEIIYVDDGSTDLSSEILRELATRDERVRIIRLSRNFGHQMAITAGLEFAAGDAVVVIDADLQDPPKVIADFVNKWMTGYDVVYGVRSDRDGESPFKLWTAKLFYRVISHVSDTNLPLDSGDFRLLDRRVVDALLSMPERDRFVRGMVSWLGFSQAAVPYRRAPRFAGTTKYPLRKMLKFAADGIASFSIVPLRIAAWLGFFVSGLSLVGIIVVLLERYLHVWGLVRGWSSTVIAILFMGGVQLMCLGIIGEYVGRIYGEAKRRPLYIVRERIGFASKNGARLSIRQLAGGDR
jgi:dolichol-phosphate mannosyltransferase